jgi:iron complex outermembrane receptor protein
LLASASYLESSQILIAGQPAVARAGTIFNPPHWRARGGLIWERDALVLTSYLNYAGGTEDRRLAQVLNVGDFTTLDLAATYRLQGNGGILDNVEITASASNLLNVAPDAIRQAVPIDPTYDSTNYSPLGRFISLSLTTRW